MVGTIFYIGDRSVGKTALAVELVNPTTSGRVSSEMNYKQLLNNHHPGTPTTDVGEIDIEIKVNFDNLGWRPLRITSTDTPGEMWREPVLPQYAAKKQEILKIARMSAGILVILSPYRELVENTGNPKYLSDDELDELPTKKQWCNRFARWTQFLIEECHQARHIAICLNKIDLVLPDNKLGQITDVLSKASGHDQHVYVTNNFFYLVTDQIAQINRQRRGVVVRCFITSIHNRTLLELPWIYLARYLSQN